MSLGDKSKLHFCSDNFLSLMCWQRPGYIQVAVMMLISLNSSKKLFQCKVDFIQIRKSSINPHRNITLVLREIWVTVRNLDTKNVDLPNITQQTNHEYLQ